MEDRELVVRMIAYNWDHREFYRLLEALGIGSSAAASFNRDSPLTERQDWERTLDDRERIGLLKDCLNLERRAEEDIAVLAAGLQKRGEGI